MKQGHSQAKAHVKFDIKVASSITFNSKSTYKIYCMSIFRCSILLFDLTGEARIAHPNQLLAANLNSKAPIKPSPQTWIWQCHRPRAHMRPLSECVGTEKSCRPVVSTKKSSVRFATRYSDNKFRHA